MTIGRNARMCLGVLVVLLGMCASATAQTNDEIFPNFQWNFSTPGARANAMGRAFIGMADDASATVSNPAGLVSLTKPQFYVEYKNTNLKVDRLSAVNSYVSLVPTTFSSSINALSFFTISMPFKDRFAIGLTRHQFLNYKENFTLAARAIPSDPDNEATFPVNGNTDATGTVYGLTFSAALSDKVDVGVTLGINQLSVNSVATRFAIVFGPGYVGGNHNDLASSPIINNQTSINQSNTAASIGFGLLVKPSEKVSIGFNFAQGPQFTVQENEQLNNGSNTACFTNTSCGVNSSLTQYAAPAGFAAFPRTVHVNVPNRIGVGIAARPTPRWLFAMDLVYINYSTLANHFTLIFDDSEPVGSLNKPGLTGAEFAMDNVTEAHFGAEYNLTTGKNPIFVRAGVFTNPDHRVKFTGFSSSALPSNIVQDVVATYNAQYNLLPRSGETRGTIGAGIALGEQLQLDLAYVFGKEFVASTAFRFK